MNLNCLDGRADAAVIAQFQQDDLICNGEAANEQAVAAPIYMGPSLANAMDIGMLAGQRNNALRQTMVGHIAQLAHAMNV